jgi:hypothetical protein
VLRIGEDGPAPQHCRPGGCFNWPLHFVAAPHCVALSFGSRIEAAHRRCVGKLEQLSRAVEFGPWPNRVIQCLWLLSVVLAGIPWASCRLSKRLREAKEVTSSERDHNSGPALLCHHGFTRSAFARVLISGHGVRLLAPGVSRKGLEDIQEQALVDAVVSLLAVTRILTAFALESQLSRKCSVLPERAAGWRV